MLLLLATVYIGNIAIPSVGVISLGGAASGGVGLPVEDASQSRSSREKHRDGRPCTNSNSREQILNYPALLSTVSVPLRIFPTFR